MEKRLINQISFDIRRIIPNINEYLNPEDLIQNIPINQYLEKADEINQLNLANSGTLIQDISQILKVDDSNLKGIGFACLAGIHTFNGNYKKAIVGFDQAFNLKVSDDVYAYILTEYGNLLRQLLRTDEAIAVLEKAVQLSDNEKLKWRIITYRGYCYKYSDKEYSFKLLSDALEYYLNSKAYSRYATILRHIISLYINNNEYTIAWEFISKVINIAEKYSLKIILRDIKIDTGWLYIKEKRYDEAREIYLELLTHNLIPYMESLVLQNLGYLEFECENYKNAIRHHKKSLRLTSKYEIFEMLFEDYYKLGLTYERLGEYGKAEKYYADGYKYLLRERNQLGIILITGYRSILIDNYMRFLSEKPAIQHASEHASTFDFTNGKTYNEILSIFKNNLLILHRKREDTIENLCSNLKISLRLYFVYQKKFGFLKTNRRNIVLKNQHFKNYLYSMLSLDWRSAINQFDKDLYRFLLEKYQYNKTNIAKALAVSNLTVIKKTAVLT